MTDTGIVLYQAEWCPFCARVRQALTDLLLDYKIVNVPRDHAQRTLLRELFGTTGIPSMTDGDVKIADDDEAIIKYVRERYSAHSADPEHRERTSA
jgi:glutaredoxin 3